MRVFHNYLAVVPLHQKESAFLAQEDETTGSRPYHSSFVTAFDSMDKSIKNVIDYTFLSDYLEPTIAILYEPKETWAGRINTLRDTCEFIVLSLNPATQQFHQIYRFSSLPFSCFAIQQCLKPLNGVVILTADSILYIEQGTAGFGHAVNVLGADFTAFSLRRTYEHLGMDLQGCQACFLNPEHLLISSRQDGALWIVELKRDGGRVYDMNIERVGSSILASGLTRIGDAYLFISSEITDAVLIRFEEANVQKTTRTLGYDEEEDDIYGGQDYLPATTTTIKLPLKERYKFSVCDSLTVIGPVHDMAISAVANAEASVTICALRT
jgi:cleavage and polyadenylation specificity factor subunit 1